MDERTEDRKREKEIFFFVDGIKYETEHTVLTGAQIKGMIPNFNPLYSLFLEEPGDEPDRQIMDDTSVSLEKEKGGPRRFYTVPPATFGIR